MYTLILLAVSYIAWLVGSCLAHPVLPLFLRPSPCSRQALALAEEGIAGVFRDLGLHAGDPGAAAAREIELAAVAEKLVNHVLGLGRACLFLRCTAGR